MVIYQALPGHLPIFLPNPAVMSPRDIVEKRGKGLGFDIAP